MRMSSGGNCMSKRWLALSLLFFGVNAYAVEREASQPYRPAGEAQQWTISGVMHGPMKMTLRINGEQIFDAGMVTNY